MIFDGSILENVDEDSKEDTECVQQPLTIYDLPDEIMEKIFSFFDVMELSKVLCRVCNRWNILANDPMLRTNISFVCRKPNVESYIPDVLSRCPYLKSLCIESTFINNDLLYLITTKLQRVSSLTFKFCDILVSDEKLVSNLIESCKSLKYIDLEGSNAPGVILNTFSEVTGLKYLNLSHCIHLNNETLIMVAKNCLQLQTLNIDGISAIEDYSIETLTEYRFSSLRQLFLDGERLTDRSFCSLEKCLSLSILSISFGEQMTDMSLKSIQKLSKLKYLKLRKANQLNAVAIVDMFEDKKLSEITYLHLGECSLIEDISLISIANNCSKLVSLCLPWCWEVTDIGLSFVIKKCSKLRILDCVGLVRLKGISLLTLPECLPELRLLDLEQCSSIDDNILIKLSSKRPDLRIFDYWGDLVQPMT